MNHPGKRKTRIIWLHFLAGVFLIALVGAAFYLTGDSGGTLEVVQDLPKQQKINASNEEGKTGKEEQIRAYEEEGIIARNELILSCNLFSGRWVFDNISYPLYEEGQCSFMMNEFACVKYGRKDLKYQNWRWQPHDCDLPRFNGTALLEKIRGKKLVFVGDSLNRNQWNSMLCLIESALHPTSDKTVVRNDNFIFFQSTEYNATIGFYWSPFLVESNCDDPTIHRVRDRIIRITGIEKHARHWTDADILVFNSYMWWVDPMTILWGSFGSSDAIYKKVETKMRLYEMALNIWSDWLEINIDRNKTKLFFMNPSAFHLHGESWDVQQNCYNEIEPILKEGYLRASIDHQMMQVAESVIQKLETRGLNVGYLNITHLSDYRKDAHPSIYREFFHTIGEEQLSNPKSYSDCTHWCLPGVPDVWNQVLYSYIINS